MGHSCSASSILPSTAMEQATAASSAWLQMYLTAVREGRAGQAGAAGVELGAWSQLHVVANIHLHASRASGSAGLPLEGVACHSSQPRLSLSAMPQPGCGGGPTPAAQRYLCLGPAYHTAAQRSCCRRGRRRPPGTTPAGSLWEGGQRAQQRGGLGGVREGSWPERRTSGPRPGKGGGATSASCLLAA